MQPQSCSWECHYDRVCIKHWLNAKSVACICPFLSLSVYCRPTACELRGLFSNIQACFPRPKLGLPDYFTMGPQLRAAQLETESAMPDLWQVACNPARSQLCADQLGINAWGSQHRASDVQPSMVRALHMPAWHQLLAAQHGTVLCSLEWNYSRAALLGTKLVKRCVEPIVCSPAWSWFLTHVL